MRLVEFGKLGKRIVADDVGVENEEGSVVFAENLLCKLEGTSCAEWFCLDGELDLDIVLCFVLGRCVSSGLSLEVLILTFLSAAVMISGL
jgi:hypothetical protein